MRAILTYHSIDDSGSVISIAPAVFEEHVRWLSKHVRVLSLDDLLSGDDTNSRDSVAITFDDGFANFRQAVPMLAEYGLPVTVFVVTGHVGGDNRWRGLPDSTVPTLPLLDWSDLDRLVAAGVSLGAHTRTHPRLTDLQPAAVGDEIHGCVEELRGRLGVNAQYLAYPYGAVDDAVADAAAGSCAAAVTTVFKPLAVGDARMRLPRLDMYYFRQPGAIGRWGTSTFMPRLRWIRAKRSVREALA